MIINFECKKCNQEFDCELGKIGIDESSMRPTFEKDIVCPRCGILTMDDVFLTELGQSQMTEATHGMQQYAKLFEYMIRINVASVNKTIQGIHKESL